MKKRRVLSWVFFWLQLQFIFCEDIAESNYTQNDNSKDLRGLFAPRMDYDQWKPLVLDRVHYWIDPALRKPDPPAPGDNQKTEILLLGVSSKKPSTGTSIADSRKDNYDSFLKFVDGPKFTNQRPHFPTYFTPNFYPKNKNFPKNEQRTPYTMLMPPPMITKRPTATTSPIQKIDTTTDSITITSTSSVNTEASTDGVTIQASNLIYHSSSLSNLNDWKTTETVTNLTPNPPTKKFLKDEGFQKLPEFLPPRNLTNLVTSGSEHNINYVTPPPLQEQEIMHKGQVSDDNLDISNTYVKIGKTEAQVHSTAIDNISEMLVAPSMVMFPIPQPLITQTPLTMQTIQNMQSMQPPPITTSPIYKKSTNPILQILEKEKDTTETTTLTTFPTTTQTSLTTDPLFKHYKQPTEPLKGPLYLIIQGHSKVKTYGPSKQFHGIKVQETNEITDKELNSFFQNNDQTNSRESRSGKLQTLKHVIETKLGAIDFSELRRKDGVKETELEFGYKVGEDVTSEKYHKGIVEEARKLHLEN